MKKESFVIAIVVWLLLQITIKDGTSTISTFGAIVAFAISSILLNDKYSKSLKNKSIIGILIIVVGIIGFLLGAGPMFLAVLFAVMSLGILPMDEIFNFTIERFFPLPILILFIVLGTILIISGIIVLANVDKEKRNKGNISE